MTIRSATERDLADIQTIYAHHVLHGTGTFEETPPSIEEMTARYAATRARSGAWLVETDATGVRGYAYYVQLRERSAYRFCVEDSVYVREDVRGRGVGAALLAALLDAAAAAGVRQMIAVIGDSANAGSIAVHTRAGFRQTGIWHACGLKFGRWLDVVHMQRAIGRGATDLPT